MTRIWILRMSGADADRAAGVAAPLLTPEERQAAARFVSPERRVQAICARGLLRLALSDMLRAPPEGWRFETAPRGRPSLARDVHGRPGVDFNVAHTTGAIVCVVSLDGRVGIDVEASDRIGDLRAVADRILAPDERTAHEPLAEDQKAAHLLRLWTLKEALAKGVGLGLGLRFDRLAFTSAADPDRDPSCSVARRWSFRLWEAASHIVAVAVRARADGLPETILDARGPLLGL